MAEKLRLEDRECPLSATLGLVGEWWTLLILHDAFDGYTRFDQFQENLGISSSLLTSRLKRLVASSLLERRQYQTNPPRYEYVLTELGRSLRPVIVVLAGWGNGPERLTASESAGQVDDVAVEAADVQAEHHALLGDLGGEKPGFRGGVSLGKHRQELAAGSVAGLGCHRRNLAAALGHDERPSVGAVHVESGASVAGQVGGLHAPGASRDADGALGRIPAEQHRGEVGETARRHRGENPLVALAEELFALVVAQPP